MSRHLLQENFTGRIICSFLRLNLVKGSLNSNGFLLVLLVLHKNHSENFFQ